MSNIRTRSEVRRVIKVLAACFVAPIVLITALPLILIWIVLTGNEKDLADLEKFLVYLASLGD
jgi:cation transport ATPase